ncbi:MAG: aldo/keto reductase [Magnetococcales bacterium]|nr:aldo/keto reductase [Magnetococcales bacterium]MBF0157005.1 aldo/keto reductase [Magnetococcales bacterium]
MKNRKLGSTGLEVSEIGCGTWGLSGTTNDNFAYGPTTDETSIQTLRSALEAGVTFYDTADLYGWGHSEKLLGEAFAGHRDRVVIASKVGYTSPEGAQDFSSDHIRRSLENSLERLRSGHIDLYLLHDPPLAAVPGALPILESLQREGSIRAFGISARSPQDALAAVKDHGVRAVQFNFNLVDQRAVDIGLFETCVELGAGTILRTPLCFGFLSKGLKGFEFHDRDRRKKWSPAQAECWTQAPDLFFGGLRDGASQTPAQLSLRYCLSFPGTSTVIPGMMLPEHVAENTEASRQGPFTAEELAHIRHVYTTNEFFVK